MPRRRHRIRHAEIVRTFARRLREVRMASGMTQAQLAREATITVPYVSRLENGNIAPGIDLAERLARALGVPVAELLPAEPPPDRQEFLRQQARRLCDDLIPTADLETLQLMVPLLSRLADR
jgi:transcriptional regulator with XRE-family HTH domain